MAAVSRRVFLGGAAAAAVAALAGGAATAVAAPAVQAVAEPPSCRDWVPVLPDDDGVLTGA